MYKSIIEFLDEVSELSSDQEKIKYLQDTGRSHPAFKLFFKWAYFNNKKPTFESIPDYRPNMVDITFSYIKLEKAVVSLKNFFEGASFIQNDKKRSDKLLTILEEISWVEAPLFEKLIMNEYSNEKLPKNLVETAFPDLKEESV
jgi:hypothetical protein